MKLQITQESRLKLSSLGGRNDNTATIIYTHLAHDGMHAHTHIHTKVSMHELLMPYLAIASYTVSSYTLAVGELA